MYNNTPGLPPDKIAPTVGQNSTRRIPLPDIAASQGRIKELNTECIYSACSRKDRVAISAAPILGSGWPARHPLHMAKVLRRLPRRGLRRRCGRPRAPQRGLGSLR